MDFATLIVHLLGGCFGSLTSAAICSRLNMAVFSKVLAGIVGGGMGGQILSTAFNLPIIGTGSADALTMLAHIASAGLGGAMALWIIGLLRSHSSP
jgi:uncharacterized membrane protein YeaQ/YmgE (transglycosylase-associated protein family)